VALVTIAGVQVAQRPDRAAREAVAPRTATTAVARSASGVQAARGTPEAAQAPAAAPAGAPDTELAATPEPTAVPAAAAEPIAARAGRSALPASQSASARRRARAHVPGAAEPAGVAHAPEAVAASEDELALEVRWLDQARALLAGDPAAALARADAHAQRFAAGALAAERELIAVDALQRLGRAPQARKRADALLARNPGSLYRGRLQRVLARDANR
jgi:hypothetical protein